MLMTLKILVSSFVIAFASWLSGRRPELAGFIVALPLNTLLVLAFSHAEYHDPATSVKFARSIVYALPLGLTFFIPFFLAERLQFGFWWLYGIGIGFLVAAFFVHAFITKAF